MKTHPLVQMMQRRKEGIPCGIPSYCSANKFVLEAALRRAKETGDPVLIEATANQVNQFGGYTGMKPKDFYNLVRQMAADAGLPEEQLILGGDHLGPLTWQHLPEAEAMELAKALVYEYARAGFTKIHLDTSMKLHHDPEGPLSVHTVARRGAVLYREAMRGYSDLLAENPQAVRPVFVIGSEVPIPGGAQEAEDSLSVTSPEDFRQTVLTYQQVFAGEGITEGLQNVIAVVVQPGVEFGDDQVFLYDHNAAKELCAALSDFPGLCFEGHSTDYQSPDCLRQMVRDGIAILKVGPKLAKYPQVAFEGHSTDYQSAKCLREMVEDGIIILKVGPALTYGLREALFSLSLMEKELVPEDRQAHFIETLEQAMLQAPENWKKHYHGDEKQLALARKYSFSDRARYYMDQPQVISAIDRLFENLRLAPIPMNMLHQYMPVSYSKVRDGQLSLDPKELALDGVVGFMLDYEFADLVKSLDGCHWHAATPQPETAGIR